MNYDEHGKPMFEFFVRELKRLNVEFLNATLEGRVDCVPRVGLEAVCEPHGTPGVIHGAYIDSIFGVAPLSCMSLFASWVS